MMESTTLRNFLEIPYDQLEELNIEAKQKRLERVDRGTIEEDRRKYLTDEKRIKIEFDKFPEVKPDKPVVIDALCECRDHLSEGVHEHGTQYCDREETHGKDKQAEVAVFFRE